jgi:hypothetical protein
MRDDRPSPPPTPSAFQPRSRLRPLWEQASAATSGRPPSEIAMRLETARACADEAFADSSALVGSARSARSRTPSASHERRIDRVLCTTARRHEVHARPPRVGRRKRSNREQRASTDTMRAGAGRVPIDRRWSGNGAVVARRPACGISSLHDPRSAWRAFPHDRSGITNDILEHVPGVSPRGLREAASPPPRRFPDAPSPPVQVRQASADTVSRRRSTTTAEMAER